uniref:Uncharacterized protein n=1 Tax=Lepeophtheirus salmonis TaxID=72036 RepID=A0A0K2SXS9_LEPSM
MSEVIICYPGLYTTKTLLRLCATRTYH